MLSDSEPKNLWRKRSREKRREGIREEENEAVKWHQKIRNCDGKAHQQSQGSAEWTRTR